jgi:hypothetical protein
MSPHILIDQDLDELTRPGCPEHYENLVLSKITRLYTSEAISLEEFDHYCKRLNDATAQRPRSVA